LCLRLLQSLMLWKNTIIIFITTTTNNRPSRCDRQRFSSLQLRSAPSPLLVVAAGILICCLELTHDERTSRVLVPSLCDPRQNPERGHLRGCTQRRSLFRNHRLVNHRSLQFSATLVSKRPVSVSFGDPVVPSSATTATDTGTDDGSSTMGEEDWDRMDLASDLDATANALQVADGGGVVRGGLLSRKLSKNRKGRSPYLQDPHAPVPVVRPSIAQKRSWSTSQTSLQQQQGSPTGNFGAQQFVRPLRLSNVDETEYSHSPVLPTTTTTSRPSLRVWGKFGSPTSHPQSSSPLTKPSHLLAASATMPILSPSTSPPTQGPSSSSTIPVISSPVSGIPTAALAGEIGSWR